MTLHAMNNYTKKPMVLNIEKETAHYSKGGMLSINTEMSSLVNCLMTSRQNVSKLYMYEKQYIRMSL